MIRDLEIKRAIEGILTKGLLKIRRDAAFGLSRSCEVEADHLHNLPQILLDVRRPLVLYYYRTERLIYLHECREVEGEVEVCNRAEEHYAEEWKVIAAYLDQGDES